MRVLLVDHDSEALETITRAIRGVLELDCVTSKGDALLLLRQNAYDVLIACERCVDGSGLDLLGRTTRTTAPLKRIFAAAPERLQLLGPRLAPFKVQRTINYPIDLEELWLAIAQVTGDPNDETDGTIERVVLDERGIPSTGSAPRAPITPRPAPLSVVPPPPPPAVSAGGPRTATARMTQPAPEPPLRAPPVRMPPPPAARAPVPPKSTSDTGRMRAPMPPPRSTSDTGRMRAPSFSEPMTADGPREFPAWTPEPPPEDDFAQVAAQARLGVQQKVVNEAARRRRNRVLVAGGTALVVAGAIVFAIERFYDPEARAKEAAIAAEVQRMKEAQQLNDSLTLIEIDVETAIMNNDLDIARRELARLIEKSPDHPRREFLQSSIDRAAALARLAGQDAEKTAARSAAPAAEPATNAPRTQPPPSRPRNDTVAARPPDRTTSRTTGRGSEGGTPASGPRSYGAPISEPPRREPVIPLDAPINAPPTYTARRSDTAFPGRTVEAGDAGTRPPTSPPPVSTPVATSSVTPAQTGTSGAAGSAVVPMPGAAPASTPPPPPVDVTPARIIKRVMPVAPGHISSKTSGHVVVRFSIGTNGRVGEVEILESEPQGVFDEAAQEAVRKWVYEPRKENGVAVDSFGRARLVFDAAK